MARIRTIKPEFWSDDEVTPFLKPLEALTFIGLICHADDEGRGKAHENLLFQRLHGLREVVPMTDFRAAMVELGRRDLVKIYEIDGKRYYLIPNFRKHQRIDKPNKSTLPAPTPESFRESSKIAPGPISESYPPEGKGREGKGVEGKGGEGIKGEPKSGADAPPHVSATPEAGPSAAAPGEVKASPKRIPNPVLDPLRKAAAAASVFSYNKRQLDTVLTSWVARDGQSGVLAKLQDPTSKGRDVLILFKEPKPANGTVPFKAFVAPPRPCSLCDGTGKVADLAKSTAIKTVLKPCGSCGGKGRDMTYKEESK